MPDRYGDTVDRCPLCDDQGERRNGFGRCDHVDYAAIARAGVEKCKAVLAERKENRRTTRQ